MGRLKKYSTEITTSRESIKSATSSFDMDKHSLSLCARELKENIDNALRTALLRQGQATSTLTSVEIARLIYDISAESLPLRDIRINKANDQVAEIAKSLNKKKTSA